MPETEKPSGLIGGGLLLALLMLIALLIWTTAARERLSLVANSQISRPDSIAERTGLIGTWLGRLGIIPTTLVITSGNQNLFSGVKRPGPSQVKFIGEIDETTQTIRITETQVLQGKDWALANETGKLSDDGRQISGSGKDSRAAYSWSYHKLVLADDSLARQFGFVGLWTGSQNNKPTSLLVYAASGNSFTGMKLQNNYEILITGEINSTTREVSIQETAVNEGEGWNLGFEKGQLSADGLHISGKGRDKNHAYIWSYSKSD
jgi:hypothetical protein